jgi:chromosome segregation ATPase
MEERIGLERAAEILDRSTDEVLGYVREGRLEAERGPDGGSRFRLSDVEGLARALDEEEVFEGEVMGEESESRSSLPAVPFERYERLLQQGQDYKTRLEERTRRMEEIQQERDAARMEIDRLWSEIERLNLVEFQRELQEKTISTLEEEKARLEKEREQLASERVRLLEEKTELVEERARLEAEIKTLKSRGFWGRLFGR